VKRNSEQEIELEEERQDKSLATDSNQAVESQDTQPIPEKEESLFVEEVPEGIVEVNTP
jgi:hypothetical protein